MTLTMYGENVLHLTNVREVFFTCHFKEAGEGLRHNGKALAV